VIDRCVKKTTKYNDHKTDFTLPHLIGSMIRVAYNSLVQKGDENDISIFAASQKSLSFLRKYYDSNYGIFPHLTAIIDVRDGVSMKSIF